MKNRYCINCGMSIPRKAKFCPECGFSLKQTVPAKPESGKRSGKQIKAVLYAAGFLTALDMIVCFTLKAAPEIRNARSRHLENELEEQYKAENTKPGFSLPELSMPDIHIPEIKLPEPPAAAFSIEGYEIETNLNGETVLYVNVNYTNHDLTEESFMVNFQISAMQDGELCQRTAVDPKRENHLMESVQPGDTVLVSGAFIISTEKETTVTVSSYFGGNKYREENILPHADGTVSDAE